MKKLLSLFLVLALLVTLGVGCGPKEGEGEPEGQSVALITDLGGINDESFNQSPQTFRECSVTGVILAPWAHMPFL